MPSRQLASLLLLTLSGATSMHCGASVSPDLRDGMPSTADASVPAETPSCEEIRRTCTGTDAVVVRGHAEGLNGVDGARAEFGVRYLGTEFERQGLHVPHHVARGTTTVRNGAFETCVCVPVNANVYPEIVAAILPANMPTTLGRDALRAGYSQRYATLGDEGLSEMLGVPSSPMINEVAVAALSDRSVSIAVRGIETLVGRSYLMAGLVADDRPLAPEVATAQMIDGVVNLLWVRPGAQLSNERVVLVIDQNNDRRCGVEDVGTEFAVDGRAELTTLPGPWLRGDALVPLCNALSLNASRE